MNIAGYINLNICVEDLIVYRILYNILFKEINRYIDSILIYRYYRIYI